MMEDIADWTLDWAMEIFMCLNYKYLQFCGVSLCCLSASYLHSTLLLMNRYWAWTFKSLNIWILEKEWTNLFNQKAILPYFMLFIPRMSLHKYIIQHIQPVIHHLWHIWAVYGLTPRCHPQGFFATKLCQRTWQSSFCSSS